MPASSANSRRLTVAVTVLLPAAAGCPNRAPTRKENRLNSFGDALSGDRQQRSILRDLGQPRAVRPGNGIISARRRIWVSGDTVDRSLLRA